MPLNAAREIEAPIPMKCRILEESRLFPRGRELFEALRFSKGYEQIGSGAIQSG